MPPIQRNRQWHRPQQGQQTPDSDPRRQQQPQSTGLLDQIGQTANTPLDFSGAPPIRDQNIIQPSTSPVDVPGAREATGPLQATGPVGFSGPNQLGYGGQRIGTGQTFSAPGDVRGVGAGQQGQYGMGAGPGVGPSRMIGGPGQSQRFGMQSGPGVGPSRTMGFDPNSGAYFQAPNRDFAGQGDSLEQATFQRGLNRIDPYLQEQRSAMAQRLQNQGLPVGSKPYNQELNRFDRSRGDQLENLALSSVGQADKSRGACSGRTSLHRAVQRWRSATPVRGALGSHVIQRRRARARIQGSSGSEPEPVRSRSGIAAIQRRRISPPVWGGIGSEPIQRRGRRARIPRGVSRQPEHFRTRPSIQPVQRGGIITPVWRTLAISVPAEPYQPR